MNIKKGLVAAAIGTGVALSATACGPGYGGGGGQAEYCVDSFGHVEPAYYCNGNGFYGGQHYYMFLGNLHGHSYGPGAVIPHSYFTHGSRIDPGNSAARQKAGLPASGAFKNGSAPARSQSGPARSGGGSSSKIGGFGGSTKSGGSSTFGGGSKSFGGGSSSSRIGGFSGGRK